MWYFLSNFSRLLSLYWYPFRVLVAQLCAASSIHIRSKHSSSLLCVVLVSSWPRQDCTVHASQMNHGIDAVSGYGHPLHPLTSR
jgi:hypothetical protein